MDTGTIALIIWVLTAIGGAFLASRWVAQGGLREERMGYRWPPALVIGHGTLAVVGLVLWIVYVAGDSSGFGVAAAVLIPFVALGGLELFRRWFASREVEEGRSPEERRPSAEPRLPEPVVAIHGLLAVATIVFVMAAVIL